MEPEIELEPQPEGGYVARIVGVAGAISEGETEEEAMAAVLDALRELRAAERAEHHEPHKG